MAKTRAMLNKEVRVKSIREQLSHQKHIEHAVDSIVKIEQLDPHGENFSNSLQKYKIAAELRLRVSAKYLPDLKSAEAEVDSSDDGTLTITWSKPEDKA